MTVITHPADYRQLAGVDVVKYVMAFCVVAIHFRPNYDIDWVYPGVFDWFIKLAVPFFFITSGYLLQRKFEGCATAQCAVIARRRALKILRLWVCWLLISLPLAIYSYTDFSFPNALRNYAYNILVNGWAPRAAPLWFLYSMMWICLIISVAVRIKGYRQLLLVLFLVTAFLNWYADVSKIHILLALKIYTGHILGGGAYMLAGMLLRNVKKPIGGGIVLIVTILSCCLFATELPFWQIAGGVALFLAALKLPVKPSDRLLGLRSQSMWVYYTHEYVLFIFFKLLAITAVIHNPWAIMALVFAFLVAEAFILSRLQQLHGLKFLQFLVR